MRPGALLIAALALATACQTAAADESSVSVDRGALVVSVEVSGQMRAVDADRIGPPPIPSIWNYEIAMMAPEGTEVDKGQPVLAFDASELERRLDEKTAERDSAATQLDLKLAAARVTRHDEELEIEQAKADLRKAKLQADAPEDLTATIDLEKARLDLELAREKVAYLQRKSRSARRSDEAEVSRWKKKHARAQERVQEIGEAIEQMTVASPRAGTVIYQTNWKGEKKKVGDSAWRAETVLQIVSLEQMEADGQIDEVDVSKVAVGAPVSLRLDAQADIELRGRVRDVSQTVQRASPDNPLKVVHLDIELETDEGVPLRPGMRFRGAIETERLEDALLVPLDAVFATPEGPVAYRRGDGGLQPVRLSIGRRNAHRVVVTEGLREGDEIVRADAEGPPS